MEPKEIPLPESPMLSPSPAPVWVTGREELPGEREIGLLSEAIETTLPALKEETEKEEVSWRSMDVWLCRDGQAMGEDELQERVLKFIIVRSLFLSRKIQGDNTAGG